MTCLGVEIGGTKLQVVVGEPDGRIVERCRFAVDRAAGGAGIRALLSEHLQTLVRAHSPSALGVGFGGPVDWRAGRICCSHQISGWHDFELGDWLRAQTGLPVAVDNDANVAALGEARHGAGLKSNPVFWINMGSGVGGGLVVDGHIYHGASPGEAEIGHVRLDKSGTLVEDRCSGWAVDCRIREAAKLHPSGPLARLIGTETRGEARFLAAALAEGDELAHAILSELSDNLAFALSHVVQLLHPQIIVVGGGLSLIGEPLRDAIASALPQYVMDSFQPGPRVTLAGLGEDSVPIGALVLAGEMASRAG
ncbi:MAG TPA: ROK family protein [Verrucomicrobiota bacterium]|nr:sugar kinase [Verrucomicrobiales bacterium]HRI14813.1 ROK family protein [Verrucomicrobiota bacterium]